MQKNTQRKRRVVLDSVTLLTALLFAAVIGCSGDSDNGNGNGNTSDDFAKMKIVGQNNGEPPQTVAVGSFTVLAVISTDKDGKPVQLDAGHEFLKSVTWKSSDASVAIVISQQGGVSAGAAVQALKAGKTTVTAAYKNLSASMTLTVQ